MGIRSQLAIVVGAAACTIGTSGCEPAACRMDAGPPMVSVNSTSVESPSVIAGTPFFLNSGGQGGHHFWMQMRTSGTCTTDAFASITVRFEDRVVARGQSRPGAWRDAEGSPGTYRTDPIQVVITDDIALCTAIVSHSALTVEGSISGPHLSLTAQITGTSTSGLDCARYDVRPVDAADDGAIDGDSPPDGDGIDAADDTVPVDDAGFDAGNDATDDASPADDADLDAAD